MRPLPPGWEWTPVGDVACDVRSGFASGKHNAVGSGIPHLRPMNVSRLGAINLEEVKYVDPGVDERRLAPGDVLFNNTNSSVLVGKTALFRQDSGEFAFSNHMTRVRTEYGVVPAFVAAQLHFLWMTGQLSHLITNHVNQASISAQTLARRVELAIPPTAEQERIVAAFEEHLSRLDAAEVALRSAAARVDWLPASARATAFRQPWPRRPLGSVAHTQLGKMLSAKSRTGTGSTPYLRNRNVRWGSVDLSEVAVMDFSDAERDRFRLVEGDVLICEGGAGVGRTAIWRGELQECCYQKALHRVRTGDELVPEFLVQYLRYLAETRRLEQHLSGVAIGHFPQEDLRTLEIPVPPVADQHRFLDQIGSQESFVEVLSAAFVRSASRAQALRRSILAAAFSGQLVPQDPDEEPTSVLLGRMRAERLSATPTKTRGRYRE
ncbi:MAG: restriction endonuclease subunit S [Acidimicrobiales bacterium]